MGAGWRRDVAVLALSIMRGAPALSVPVVTIQKRRLSDTHILLVAAGTEQNEGNITPSCHAAMSYMLFQRCRENSMPEDWFYTGGPLPPTGKVTRRYAAIPPVEPEANRVPNGVFSSAQVAPSPQGLARQSAAGLPASDHGKACDGATVRNPRHLIRCSFFCTR